MRLSNLRFVICLVLLAATAATAIAAPPQEVRTLVESGVSAVYSPDGKWLAYKSELLRLGVMSTARNARPNPEGDFSHFAFTADSKFLVAADTSRKIQFIDLARRKSIRTIAVPFRNENDIVQSLTVSKDGKTIAVTTLLGSPMICDAAKGAKLVDLEKCIAHQLKFTKDDATLLGYDGDGRICTWEASSGKLAESWKVAERDIVRCAFSPDDTLAAAAEADTGVVRLWDLQGEKEVGRLQNLDFVSSIAISPDGKTLAVGCGERKSGRQVKLWDLATQQELEGLKDLSTRALGLSFSPDGKFLVVATQGSDLGNVKAATRLYALP